jgi:hypothetical protein
VRWGSVPSSFETKIRHFDAASLVEENVLRFDVGARYLIVRYWAPSDLRRGHGFLRATAGRQHRAVEPVRIP